MRAPTHEIAIQMTERREKERREVRDQIALAKKEAIQKARRLGERVALTVSNARVALVDVEFVEVLRSQGVRTLPLLPQSKTGLPQTADDSSAPGEVTLEFVIVWTFFYSLFGNREIVAFMERTWPGFMLDLKDTFIALVVEGPFPHAVSGHRGRRHGARYFESTDRSRSPAKSLKL